MLEGRKLLKTLIALLALICFLVTALVGSFYFAYSQEIDRILAVGLIVKTQYLHDVSMSQMLQGAAKGMVESLQDPYSVYMNQKEFKNMQQYIQGSIAGIGIYVGVKDNKLIVISPIEGTPAYKAGIQRDDEIIKINETLTGDIDEDQAVALMRGDPGTQVTVTVLREGIPLEFTLIREVIDIPSVESKLLPDKIGYLRIKLFSSNSDEALSQQLQGLQKDGMKALVLDLRDNPGGDLDSAVNIAKNFVSQGPIVFIVNKSGDTEPYAVAEGNNVQIPLAVLINGGSASASEVLSGAIKDTKTGVLIGEKSFGKGIVQGVFQLSNEEGLKLTTSKYLTPNKIDIHDKGIEPDIIIKPGQGNVDVQLQKSLEVLKEKIK